MQVLSALCQLWASFSGVAPWLAVRFHRIAACRPRAVHDDAKFYVSSDRRAMSRGQNGMSDPCPLYPRKQTCAVQTGMSALGHKRTWPRLFDHLLCSVQQTKWNGEAQRSGRLEIDHQLERGRLYN